MLVHEVLIYRVCAHEPTTRTKVTSMRTGSQLAYFHSFGVSPHYAVLPMQHITFSMAAVITSRHLACCARSASRRKRSTCTRP